MKDFQVKEKSKIHFSRRPFVPPKAILKPIAEPKHTVRYYEDWHRDMNTQTVETVVNMSEE